MPYTPKRHHRSSRYHEHSGRRLWKTQLERRQTAQRTDNRRTSLTLISPRLYPYAFNAVLYNSFLDFVPRFNTGLCYLIA